MPDHPYSSSHDDNDAMIDSPIQGRTVGRLSRAGHQLHHDPYSPLTSLHDDSLPSGIPNKFRLSMFWSLLFHIALSLNWNFENVM